MYNLRSPINIYNILYFQASQLKKKKKPLTHIFSHPACLQLKIEKVYIVEQ